MEDLNRFIKKRHIKSVVEFNDELRKWAEYTEGSPDEEAGLYEDVNTPFTLSHVRVEDGCLKYRYDGKEESENMVRQYEDTKEYYEVEGLDSIPEYVKFWKSCLRRARKYWEMDPDTLDRMSDGEEEDIEDAPD